MSLPASTEIERRFLIVRADWRAPAEGGVRLDQAYLSVDPDRSIRVRVSVEGAWLTIKGRKHGGAGLEFEYPIPPDDARRLMSALSSGSPIEKTRYRIDFAGKLWEVDEFHGENEGLMIAEIELDDIAESIDLPPWVGSEITEDHRYANVSLATRPYKSW